MKKVFLSLLLITFLFTNAQKNPTWFDIALTGSGGGCLLTSKNIFGDTKTVTSSPAFCYGVGAKLGINFNESNEIAVNAEFYSRSQKYGINLDSLGKFNKTIDIKGVDLSVLYRFRGKESSGYAEIGPQMSFITAATENRDDVENDVTAQLQPNYFSAVFGFGSNMVVSNAFTWTIGFRFTYGLSDMISSIGGRGSNISYPLNDSGASKAFTNYAPFRATTLQLHTELTLDMGYFTKSKCKRGRVSFLRFK